MIAWGFVNSTVQTLAVSGILIPLRPREDRKEENVIAQRYELHTRKSCRILFVVFFFASGSKINTSSIKLNQMGYGSCYWSDNMYSSMSDSPDRTVSECPVQLSRRTVGQLDSRTKSGQIRQTEKVYDAVPETGNVAAMGRSVYNRLMIFLRIF